MRRRLSIIFGLLALAACTPELQAPGPARDEAALSATALHTPDGLDLPLRVWLPWDRAPAGVILALHGFNDYSNAFRAAGRAFARRGFIVYAYDQRGFGASPDRGLWPGADALIADAALAARLLKARYPDLPLYLLGESMGGAVLLAAATGADPPPADGLVLVAPAVWGRDSLSGFQRRLLDLAYRLAPRLRVTAPARAASDNRSALRALARDPLVMKGARIDAAHGLVELMTRAFRAVPRLTAPRWLILFGAREAILDRGAVAAFLAHLPPLDPAQGRIARYRRGHHLLLRDLDAELVYGDIAAWLRDPAAPLPSGADKQR